MKIVSRFLTPPNPGKTVQLTLDGETITAHEGVTVAAALLSHSGCPSRETAKNAHRTSYCMMGICFECLVEVDGQPNTQACMTQVRDGMQLRRQIGLRTMFKGHQND
jgi:predicted molibdopterin-dependent oxidoreductase YjgC